LLLEILGRSLTSLAKKGCFKAYEAEIRVFGFLSSILRRRSRAAITYNLTDAGQFGEIVGFEA
jgi:hypothetical protein